MVETGNSASDVPLGEGAQGSPGHGNLPLAGGPSEEAVDRTRAWTGLWVVVGGDVAIAVAAGIALWKFASASSAVLASVLSSAFAAISTMTTAYFGIRESSNMAQRSIKNQPPDHPS